MTARRIAPERLAPLRAAAQLLHRPSSLTHPADVARAIGGAQSQDARAGRLALRARSPRLTAARVEQARLEERSLLRAWAMRGTVHLMATDFAETILPLYEPLLAAESRRRLDQLGMEARTVERALALVARSLKADGRLSRTQLSERLRARDVHLDPSTRMHVFRLAVTGGLACLGEDVSGNSSLVHPRDWLPARPRHDRDGALRELARRYVGGFGPATEADFALWSGLPLRDVRAGLSGIAGELTEVRVGDAAAWTLRGPPRRAARGVVRLLPPWDTYLMGYRDRDFFARGRWPDITAGGGILRATILRDGVAIGTWAYRGTGPKTAFEVGPFARLDSPTRAAIEKEIADVRRFEGHE